MLSEDLEIGVEIRAGQGVAVVTLAGHIDGHTFGKLAAATEELFKQNIFKIIFDLSGVTYIASAGVGQFVGTMYEVQNHHGNLVLVNPKGNLKEMVMLLGLPGVLQFADSVERAVELLQSGAKS